MMKDISLAFLHKHHNQLLNERMAYPDIAPFIDNQIENIKEEIEKIENNGLDLESFRRAVKRLGVGTAIKSAFFIGACISVMWSMPQLVEIAYDISLDINYTANVIEKIDELLAEPSKEFRSN